MEPTKLKNAHSAAGPSLLEMLWTELDTVMDRLMADGGPDLSQEKTPDKFYEEFKNWGEERGQAQGLAYSIALIENPYKVSVPRVKKKAMKRWEARNAEK